MTMFETPTRSQYDPRHDTGEIERYRLTSVCSYVCNEILISIRSCISRHTIDHGF